jgi:hypothetical protein
MELPVQMEEIPCWGSLYHGVVSREELSESGLPDALPDVARVLEVECHGYVQGTLTAVGGSFTGTLKAEVLYQSEEEGVRAFAVSVPLQFTEELPGVREGAVLHARVQSATGDARVLGPRKILLRLGLFLEVQVFGQLSLPQSATLPQGEEWGMELRMGEETTQVICAVPQKPFAFSDRLMLPGGQKGERILKCRPLGQVDEARVVGSKLMVKGTVKLEFLLRRPEGDLGQVSFDLPFSQILDSGGADESAQAQGWVTLTDCDYALAEGGSAVDITFDLTAQAVVRQERTLNLLEDGYSLRCPAELKRESLTCLRQVDGGTLLCPFRETLESGTELRRVEDTWITLGLTGQRGEGNTRSLWAELTLHACVSEEGGRITSLSRSCPISVEVEVEPEDTVEFSCQITGLQGELAPSGAVIRGQGVFSYRVIRQKQVEQGKTVILREDAPWAGEESPSLVLRRVQPGEGLWQLAKAYHTRGAEILTANGLDGETLEEGRFLLIPKSR